MWCIAQIYSILKNKVYTLRFAQTLVLVKKCVIKIERNIVETTYTILLEDASLLEGSEHGRLL